MKNDLFIDPKNMVLSGVTITAQITQDNNIIELVIILTCNSEHPVIKAGNLNVFLQLEDLTSLKPNIAPSGALPEFSTGLGKVVNAKYTFKKNLSPPQFLIVQYNSDEARFKLSSLKD